MYGSGDQAGELYDSGDGDFGGECGDDESSGDGHGGGVLAVVVAAAVAVLPTQFKDPSFRPKQSRVHREPRSGEICFSTSIARKPTAAHLHLLLQVPAVILNASEGSRRVPLTKTARPFQPILSRRCSCLSFFTDQNRSSSRPT